MKITLVEVEPKVHDSRAGNHRSCGTSGSEPKLPRFGPLRSGSSVRCQA